MELMILCVLMFEVLVNVAGTERTGSMADDRLLPLLERIKRQIAGLPSKSTKLKVVEPDELPPRDEKLEASYDGHVRTEINEIDVPGGGPGDYGDDYFNSGSFPKNMPSLNDPIWPARVEPDYKQGGYLPTNEQLGGYIGARPNEPWTFNEAEIFSSPIIMGLLVASGFLLIILFFLCGATTYLCMVLVKVSEPSFPASYNLSPTGSGPLDSNFLLSPQGIAQQRMKRTAEPRMQSF